MDSLDAVVPPGRIVSVTVYTRAARVVREIDLPLLDGIVPRRVRVGGLPAGLAAADVTARVLAPAGAANDPSTPFPRVVALRTELEGPGSAPHAGPNDPARQALRFELVRRQKRLAVRARLLEELDAARFRRRPVRQAPHDGLTKRTTSARLQYARLTAARRGRLEAECRTLKAEVAEIERQLAATADGGTSPAGAAQAFRTAVLLETAGTVPPGTTVLRLEVAYFVSEVRRQACGRLRFERGMERAELLIRAAVAQHTGEDWTDVRLEVVSADRPRPPRLELGGGWRAPPASAEEWDRSLDDARRDARSRIREMALRSAEVGPKRLGGETPASAPIPATAVARDVRPAERPPAEKPPAGRDARRGPTVRERRDAAGDRPGRAIPPRADAADRSDEPAPIDWRQAERFLDYERFRMTPLTGTAGGSPGGKLTEVDPFAEAAARLGCEPQELRRALSGKTATEEPPVVRAETAVRRTARGLCSIPSDGRFHVVDVDERPVAFQVRHVAVPRSAPEAYRIAVWTNPFPGPLPGGPLDVLAEGEFLKTVPLPDLPAGAPCELVLGPDRHVRLHRTTSFKEAGTLLTGSVDLRHQVTIEVENAGPTEIRLEVQERIPVAAGERVQVRQHDVGTPWEPLDGPACPGGFRRVVTLAPHARCTLGLAYTIGIWSTEEILGGNRRE